MILNIIEVSDKIKKLDFKIKKSHTSSDLNEIKNGLYLMLIENSINADIKDKNANKKSNTTGKVVAPENSKTIKFGKFENGLINRMSGYSKHFHYSDNQPSEENVFQRVLTACHCLDLTSFTINSPHFNPAAIYEPFWNRSLDFYFKENKFLHQNQNNRSEYRVLSQEKEINKDNFVNIQFLESIKQSINDSFVIFSSHFKKET